MTGSAAGELRILESQYARFSAAMLEDAPLETVAGVRAGWWIDDAGAIHLLWRDAAVADGAAYIRRAAAGAVVRPTFYAPTIKSCRNSGEAFLLSHTHPFSDHPAFSGIDDGGEDELIPKVRARAERAPHGGLVLGRLSASVRAWPPGASGAVPLALRRVGRRDLGATARAGYARQDLALGPGTANALAAAHVAIIGTGGLGWVIATTLWRHGVGHLSLVDPDRIEESNLSRLPGARRDDLGVPKTRALEQLLQQSRTDGTVTAIVAPLADRRAREAVASADVVVGATDTLQSRLDLDRFSRRMLILYVDCGINITVSGEHVDQIGGRVNVVDPLGPCLLCMGVLQPDAIAAEAEPLGYRARGRAEEAAALAFNTVIAGLASVEVLDLLLGFRGRDPGSRYIVYDGVRGITREIAVPEPGRCGTCRDLAGAVFGQLP
jgi:molybdopterin/thiamine biosynthesis adenylyltransferase